MMLRIAGLMGKQQQVEIRLGRALKATWKYCQVPALKSNLIACAGLRVTLARTTSGTGFPKSGAVTW